MLFFRSKKFVKFSLVLLIATFSLTIVGCSAKKQTENKAVQKKESVKEETVNEKSAKLYNEVLDKITTYDFDDNGETGREYKYAIVKMDGNDISQMLVYKKPESIVGRFRVFSYDPKGDKLIEPIEVIGYGVAGAGGFRGEVRTNDDAMGLYYEELTSGTGDSVVMNIKIKDNSLNTETVWEGKYDNMPSNENTKEIKWVDISDRSELSKLAGKTIEAKALESEVVSNTSDKSKDGDNSKTTSGSNKLNEQIAAEEKSGRVVLDGTIKVLTYDGVLELQGKSDPNSGGFVTDEKYIIFVLSKPQSLNIKTGDNRGKRSGLVKMIRLSAFNGNVNYNESGKNIKISIDTDDTYWPSDTSLPLGEPGTSSAKILDGSTNSQAVIKVEPANEELAKKVKNTNQTVKAKNTNMREKPSKNSAIVRTLLSGTTVYVIDTYIESPERMWCKINYDGATGWISYNTINGSIK